MPDLAPTLAIHENLKALGDFVYNSLILRSTEGAYASDKNTERRRLEQREEMENTNFKKNESFNLRRLDVMSLSIKRLIRLLRRVLTGRCHRPARPRRIVARRSRR